ncbi:hemagglutinin repeat-containing protein [Providencia rettgeri]
MNKHCYRIIFNRARQLLMVVADIAKSRVKTPSSRRSGRSAPDTSLSVTLKPLVWSLALAVGAVSFHTTAAVVADGSAPGNQQPTIIAGANGTPQVNIQSPNSSGVSHNKYQNFDVDNKGVILNNSAVNTQTQLGGLITGNPWLAKGEASVILNEINSANPSQLNGFVEVAGKRADVIIANPAGITCSGCGFINANKTTLAAAQVLLEQGKIAGFDVKNGQIAIQGNGLNDTQSDYTQLIARAVKINAKLHAKDLSVTTGKNRTDANGKVLSTEATSDAAPEFAIDVASLGGMYANKIRLVGTEKGVGVRNAGHLGADVGGFTLTTEGKLQNTGILESKGDSTLNVAQAVSQQGQWLTEGNASLITQANMQQSGTISAGKNLTLQANQLTQSDNGHLLAGVNVAGQKQTAGDLTLKTTEALQLQGKLSASGQLSATGTDIHAQNAQIESQRLSLTALTGDLDLTDAQVSNAQRAALQAKQQISTSGATVSVGDLTADSASWDNTNGTVVAQNTLALRMSQLNNTQGTLGAGQSVTLNSQTLDNTQGSISSQGNLTIAGYSTARTQQVNNAQGALNAGTEMDLQTEQLVGKGDIVSTGNATLPLGQAWVNQQHIQTGGNLTVNAEKGLTNHAQLLAGKILTLKTSTLNNTKDGEIQGETTTLNVDTLNNTGVIDGGTTSITSQTLNNQDSGRIYGDTVIINSRVLNNIKTADSTLAPLIAGRDALYLGVQKLQNQDHALLLSGGDLQIGGNATAAGVTGRSDEINNHSATLEANGEIVIDTTVLDNRDIHLSLSDTPIEVDRESFHEHEWCDGDGDGGCYGGDGTRYVMQPKYGNVTSYAINPDGSINYNVSLIGGDKNRYRFCVGSNCQKHFYEYYYDRVTYETQIINQDPAVIRSGKGMTLRGETLTNQDGHLLAGGALTIDATHFNNLETQGERWVREVDTPGHEGRGTISHYKGGSDWETKQSYYTYQGVNTTEALSLGTLKKVENTQEAPTVTLDPGKKNPALDEIIVKYPPVLDITLPDNSLYQLHPGSDSEYLIETDARFTNRKKWLSSLDYLDSDSLFKRLGDGYYEQSLIRDQLIAATGNQYLGNYTDSNAQYEALLTAGIAYGEKYQLTPGIALSAEQMANLTTDMVWMVNQAVTLPDGSIEMVSVPKVYLAASNANTLTAQGGLVSGKSVTITTTDDTQNQGTIFGERVDIDAKNIDNRGTIKGDSLTLNAQNDIINTGGTLHAKQSLEATAGRDLILKTEQHQDGKEGWLDRPATVYVENEDGTLNLSGFRDVKLIAAQVISQGKETTITAGRDLNLETQKVSHATDYTRDSERYDRRESTQDIGSALSTQGNLTLNAGNDVNIKGSEVRSDATLNVDAGNNLNITAGESTFDQDARSKWTDKKLLSKTTHTLHGEVHEKTAQSSTLSGNQVNLNAGKDITVSASNVMAENDLTATAGNNLNITTADELREDDVERTKKTSGITSSGGLGFTVGKQSVKQTTDTDSNQKKGSVIGSTAGNVTLTAGNTATIHGSDVIAAKDINVTASDINITAAENTRTDVTTTETKSSGLSVSLGGSVGSALNTAYQTGKAAQETDDDQLKALQGIKAGLKLEQANQAGQLAAAQNPGSDMTNNGSFGVDVSYGSSSSKSTSKTEQKTASGSNLTAGDNLTLNATGKAADSQGNINVQGSTLNANKDLTLNAKNDINLSSATNTQTVDSKNESKGTTVGVGISAGTGWNVNASVSKGSGFEKGNSQYYTDTEVNAGKTLTINSGNDTTLTGAQASGDTVNMNISTPLA